MATVYILRHKKNFVNIFIINQGVMHTVKNVQYF